MIKFHLFIDYKSNTYSMKKFILSFVLLTICITSQAQYEPGDIDISLGTGFGLYGAKTNDDVADTSNTGSGLLNLGVNYSITQNYVIGLNIERNGFIFSNDSSDADNYGYTINYKINLQYRFINSEKNSFSFQGGIGVSSLKFGNKKTKDFVKGNGLTYEFGILFQHYYGEHIGLFINAGYGSYTYNKLYDQDGDLWLVDINEDSRTLSLSGVNARIGIQFRL